jgi:hypothetical protein
MSRFRFPSTLSWAGCLALALLGAACAQTSEPWPELPLPPHAKVEWVADQMKVDGFPMRVLHFESTASRSEIVAYYTAHWSGGYVTKPSVKPMEEATLVGQAHGPYYMTVKVSDRPHDGSGGFISISQMLGRRPERSVGGLPLMPGAKILSVVESADPGKQCRQVIATQDAGPDSARKYYESALESAGWHLVQKSSDDVIRAHAGSVEIFQRDQSELSISVMAGEGRGSSVVQTLVTKGTGQWVE